MEMVCQCSFGFKRIQSLLEDTQMYWLSILYDVLKCFDRGQNLVLEVADVDEETRRHGLSESRFDIPQQRLHESFSFLLSHLGILLHYASRIWTVSRLLRSFLCYDRKGAGRHFSHFRTFSLFWRYKHPAIWSRKSFPTKTIQTQTSYLRFYFPDDARTPENSNKLIQK